MSGCESSGTFLKPGPRGSRPRVTRPPEKRRLGEPRLPGGGLYAQRMNSERARELLTRERQRIVQGLGRLAPQKSDEPTTTDQHMAAQAPDLYDNELDEGLSNDLRVELEAVERAEQRVAARTYGLSIESGEPIPDDRLEAVPTAERTVEEQARFERGA
jgi:RNA polymerase-binding transcription factor